MKTNSELFDKKVKREAKKVFCVCCIHYDEAYEAGANSVKDILLKLDKALNTAINYLEHQEDDLIGDDFFGDKKRTMQYKARLAELHEAREELRKWLAS